MPSSYVFIDYENVQPKTLAPLKIPDFHVHVFIGTNQEKLATKIAVALQPFGENGRWVQISGNGKNALDFHIAYYAGLLMAYEKDATCYIVSNDTGFDPLVKHLKAAGTNARRVSDINKIPVLKGYSENSTDAKVEKIVVNLKSRGNSVPKTEKTLHNTINSLFGVPLKQGEVTNLVGRMKNLGFLQLEDGKVKFTLASSESSAESAL
ncbi:MAG: PIN domain-containing protein [Halocynthiibacter sp.]